jgi:hypothetical protein
MRRATILPRTRNFLLPHERNSESCKNVTRNVTSSPHTSPKKDMVHWLYHPAYLPPST